LQVRFVAESLGAEFTQSPPAGLSDLYRDTSKVTPIIFILSTGAVPTDALQVRFLRRDRFFLLPVT
jgi:dynein heavy chain